MENNDRVDKFYQLFNQSDICDLLDVSKEQLKYILYVSKNNYFRFSILKRNGGYRTINAPRKELKDIQRKLLEILYETYTFRECQQGFLIGKSIVTNAEKHIGAKHVLNIDLENFFDTINFGRVRGMFLSKPFNFNNEVATTLAKIVTNDNMLPQGAPTSPIISNMICYTLDNNLEKYCQKYNCRYTRYADDITISTTSYSLAKQIAKKDVSGNIILGPKIIKIIENEAGFKINNKKTSYSEKIKRQEVTGIVINEKINVKRIYIKNLRAMLYNCQKNGIEKEAAKYFKITDKNIKIPVERYKQVIKGKLNFLKMVRGKYDRIFLKYAKQYNEIVQKDIFDVDIIKENKEYIEERVGVIQSREEMSQGTIQFIEGYNAITSAHVYINEDCISENVYKDIQRDKFEYPLKLEDCLDFFEYMTQKDKEKKLVPFPTIMIKNKDNDVIQLNIKNKKSFKINLNDDLQIGKKIIVAGYAEFYSFEKTGIVIKECKIIEEREIFGIKTMCIDTQIYHGMSGGPVLNENREVIGIIYYGGDYNQGLNNAFIPLKNIINILE